MVSSSFNADASIIELKGSYFEMGKTLGELYRQNKFNFSFLPKFNTKQIEMADEAEKLVEKYLPGMLDFLKGMSEAGYNYNDLRLLPLALAHSTESSPSCTVIYLPAGYTRSGSGIFIRNYDWEYSSIPLYTKTHFQLDNGIENYSFSDLWFGAYGGVNKEGLCMAITAAPTYCGRKSVGIIMTLALQWSLDHFKSCQEAIEFMERIPHLGAFNYLISDKQGNAVRIAATSEKVHFEHGSQKLMVQTNHYVNQEMEYLHDPQKLFPSTLSRYNNAHKWAWKNKGGIGPAESEKFMKLPLEEGGIFDYAVWEGKENGTIWGWYFDYETMTLHYSVSKPDGIPFKAMRL